MGRGVGPHGELPAGLADSPLPTGSIASQGDWEAWNEALAAALGDPPTTLAALLTDPVPDLAAVLTPGIATVLPVELPDGAKADAVVTPLGPDDGRRLVQLVDRSETERLARRLADAAETTERFVSRVSHDLKNPIGTAQGYAELVLEDPSLNDEVRGFATRIVTSTERAHAILLDIVADARSVSRVVPPDEVDLTVLLGEVADELDHLIAERGATVTATTPLPVLRSDRRTLARALEALVRNAVQHHPGRARVEVSARPVAAGWELLVDDDGDGIPVEARGAAFSGDGLGLKITRSALARCGAELRLATADTGGLRACVVVPQRRARDPEVPSA